MTQNLDIFADIQTSDTEPTDATESVAEVETSEPETEDKPVETVAVIPDGAMSVTDFAAFMTQTLMRKAIEAGEDLDGTQYVVPQAVYQTVKAQRDRIPHVIVKGAEDSEGRVYILKDEATAWWQNRKERLATRGTGSQRASSRSAEDNLSLLGEAVRKSLYALSRLDMWKGKVEQTDKLVSKYKGFLKEQSVADDTVELAVQEATDAFNAEQAEKAAAKAKDKDKETADAE